MSRNCSPSFGGRHAGVAQGILLRRPVRMAIMGISVLASIVDLHLEHFGDMHNPQNLVMGGVVMMLA